MSTSSESFVRTRNPENTLLPATPGPAADAVEAEVVAFFFELFTVSVVLAAVRLLICV
jgi:hypothetical protein